MRLAVKSVARRVLMALAVFYCLSCLRVLLPPAIQHADVFHLARLAVQWQMFPVHQAEDWKSGNQSVPVSVDRDKIAKFLEQSWPATVIQLKPTLRNFRPSMTSLERQQMLLTLHTFVEACKYANLTYFLIGGSLLGAYRHHGFIPWDDDVDVAMNASDWMKVRHVLSRVPGFELFAPSSVQWKLYLKELPAIPNKPFKWPNVDIFFFTEDSTHIWGLTADVKGTMYAKKSDIFPLQFRPFENLQAAVPCNTEDLVLQQFSVDNCVSLAYGHKTSEWMSVTSRSCDQLHDSFPFVFRYPDVRGRVREVLKVGKRVLRNMTLPFCGAR